MDYFIIISSTIQVTVLCSQGFQQVLIAEEDLFASKLNNILVTEQNMFTQLLSQTRALTSSMFIETSVNY